MFVIITFHFLKLVLNWSSHWSALSHDVSTIVSATDWHRSFASILLDGNSDWFFSINLLKSIITNLWIWFVLPVSESWNTWNNTKENWNQNNNSDKESEGKAVQGVFRHTKIQSVKFICSRAVSKSENCWNHHSNNLLHLLTNEIISVHAKWLSSFSDIIYSWIFCKNCSRPKWAKFSDCWSNLVISCVK